MSRQPVSRLAREFGQPSDTLRELEGPLESIEAQIDPVAAPQDLASVPDRGLPHNTQKPVTSAGRAFVLDRTSTDTPNGTTVIEALSGVGRWKILEGATASVIYADFVDLDDTPPSYVPGRTYYANSILNTMTDFPDVTIQNGEEVQVAVVNKEGAAIANGTPVYISGAQGNRLAVKIPTSNDPTTFNIIGLATHDIPNNQNGRVTEFGLVRDLDTSAWAVGDDLYVDGNTLTNVRPTAAGTYTVHMGHVIVSHPTQGIVAVNIESEPVISGPTASRPALPRVGEHWFDTTLGRPIWWNGAAWIFQDGSLA